MEMVWHFPTETSSVSTRYRASARLMDVGLSSVTEGGSTLASASSLEKVMLPHQEDSSISVMDPEAPWASKYDGMSGSATLRCSLRGFLASGGRSLNPGQTVTEGSSSRSEPSMLMAAVVRPESHFETLSCACGTCQEIWPLISLTYYILSDFGDLDTPLGAVSATNGAQLFSTLMLI